MIITVIVLQVENLLLSGQGYIKLCDFGSAATVAYYPDHTWTANKRSLVEDEAGIFIYAFMCYILCSMLLCVTFYVLSMVSKRAIYCEVLLLQTNVILCLI